jgi:hypothetical protein
MARETMNVQLRLLASARVSRVGFGVAPNRSFPVHRRVARCERRRKARDREDALASTRDACATQIQ